MITLEQFTELAHRTASRYSHRSEPARVFYTFTADTLANFHRQVCAEAGRAAVPEVWKVEKGFRWHGDRQQHIPQLVVEFEPVSFDGPCDAKGWRDRDAVAAMLSAAPARTAIEAQAAVPAGMVLVPVELLKRAESSLGSFCSDHG